jgi:RNA polymerase sigma factor (sigma-70 family)
LHGRLSSYQTGKYEQAVFDMQDKPKNSRDSEEVTVDILRRLSSVDAGPAWVEFIDRYSPLIMRTASQFDHGQNQSSECFLYVCEQLNEDGFRRLLKFNTQGKAKFKTWLGTVVFNLCVDWHRREFGRATLIPAISALPAFDRAVYRLVIEQGMSKETSFQMLRADFPDLTRKLVESAVLRVYSLITPRQRWQVTVRNRRLQLNRGSFSKDPVQTLPDLGKGPEAQAQKQQDIETLQNAMVCLPARQRLLLRLRFQEGLNLEKIAELTQLGDTNRAWRHVQTALRALFEQIHGKNSAEKRKS